MSRFPSVDLERKIGMSVGTISYKWALPSGVSFLLLDKIVHTKHSDVSLILKEVVRINKGTGIVNLMKYKHWDVLYGIASRFSFYDIRHFVQDVPTKNWYNKFDRVEYLIKKKYPRKFLDIDDISGKAFVFEWFPSYYTLQILENFVSR